MSFMHRSRRCRDGGQRFGVRDLGFRSGNLEEAAFKDVDSDALWRFEQLREPKCFGSQTLRLEQVRDSFRQPGVGSVRQRGAC
jgi:hypothetical protein